MGGLRWGTASLGGASAWARGASCRAGFQIFSGHDSCSHEHVRPQQLTPTARMPPDTCARQHTHTAAALQWGARSAELAGASKCTGVRYHSRTRPRPTSTTHISTRSGAPLRGPWRGHSGLRPAPPTGTARSHPGRLRRFPHHAKVYNIRLCVCLRSSQRTTVSQSS